MKPLLILMRHAKSSWDAAGMRDFERPLAPRGHDAADRMGRWLAETGHAPQAVLCSPARRARETWAHVARHLPAPEVVLDDPRLYLAEPATIWSLLEGVRHPSVLVIGHNPGIGELAGMVAHPPPAHPKFAKYPTCATLIAEFDAADWATATPADGRTLAFAVPRDLGGS